MEVDKKVIFGVIAAIAGAGIVVFLVLSLSGEPQPDMTDDQEGSSGQMMSTTSAVGDESADLSTIRAMAGSLVGYSALTRWLATDDFLAQFVTLVVGINAGRTPTADFYPFAPEGTLLGTEVDGRLYLDASSYRRYNRLVSAVDKLSARALVDLYALAESRLNSEYARMGHPPSHGTFRDQLKMAIDRVVAVRVNQVRVPLVRDSVVFKYKARNLENASDVNKLMYRMGPNNSLIVQEKLREIKALL